MLFSCLFYFLWQAHLVHSLECNGTRFRRMLFHMKGRLVLMVDVMQRGIGLREGLTAAFFLG